MSVILEGSRTQAPPPFPGASPGISDEAVQALQSLSQNDGSKVVVRFKATGNAPVMKQQFFKVTASNRFQVVISFLRRELNWPQKDALFLYINASFSPSPDDTVCSLYKCFGVEKQLIVNYSTTAAWG